MTTPGHEDNQGMCLYIVLYDYDPKLVGLKSEIRANHRAFMRRLNSLGTVLSTGRTATLHEQGSLTIMLARDAEEAKQILADDPYAQAGIVKSMTVREWSPVVGTFANC
ncbi:YciI family protein [Varibaculum cambriense]|uniref:YciI family protein n=1 Tax=Varibaculum cambriense TaxID=184870 RepID=UPI00255703BD|nr:YciI family protein [Varibaculum cambriense]MDK8274491.1 YciI family protein [Varibaculum cambriense]